MNSKHLHLIKAIKLALCAAIALQLAGCDVFNNTTPAEKVQKAQQANNFNEAVFFQKQVVADSPQDPAERILLGELYLQMSLAEPAEKELVKAVEFGDSQASTKRSLIKAMYMQRKYDEIIELPSSYSLPDTETQFYIASSMFNNGIPVASQIKEAVNDCDKEDGFCLLGASIVAQQEQNNAKALQLTEQALATQNVSSYAYFVLANIGTATGDFLGAINALQVYLEREPWDSRAKAYLADLYIKAKQFTKATGLLAELSQEFPKNSMILYLQSYNQFEQKQFEKASDIAEQAYAVGGNSVSLRLVAGMAAYYTGKLELAYKHLHAIENALPDTHNVHNILASLELELNLKGSDKASSTARNTDVILAEATSRLSNKDNTEKAKMLLDEIVNDSEVPLAKKFYAGLLEQSFIEDRDYSILRRLIKENPSYVQPRLALAMAAVNNRNFEEAHAFADELLELSESPRDGLQIHGIAYARNSEWQKANNTFSDLLKLDPRNVLALSYFIERAVEDKNIKDARVYSKKLAEVDIAYIGSWKRVEAQIGDPEVVNEYIKQRFEKAPNDLRLAIYQAQTFNEQKQYGKAITLLNGFSDAPDLPAEHRNQLGFAYMKSGKLDEAVEVFSSWRDKHAELSDAWVKVIIALDIAEDFANALLESKKAALAFPDAHLFKVLVIHYLTITARFDEAELFINNLTEDAKSQPSVQFTVGKLYFRAKDFDKALYWLNNSMDSLPNSRVALGLASAYLAKNDKALALKVLNDFNETIRGASDTHQMAGLLLINDEPEKALVEFEKALAYKESTDNYNNVAFALHKTDKQQEALEAVERALAMDAENVAAIQTKVRIMVKLDRNTEALDALNEAIGAFPEDEDLMKLKAELGI